MGPIFKNTRTKSLNLKVSDLVRFFEDGAILKTHSEIGEPDLGLQYTKNNTSECLGARDFQFYTRLV